MLCIQDNEPRNTEEPVISDDELVILVCSFVDQYAGLKRLQITGFVSPQETSSWSIKLAQAQAALSGGPSPMLDKEAEVRGITTQDLANRVLANSQAFQMAEAIISGTAGKHKDTIKALQTRDEVVNYDWRDGWPV